MFEFSEAHKWQNENGVRQILVFSSVIEKQKFNEAFNEAQKDSCVSERFSENSFGAIWKLRAVLDNQKKWISLIRYGDQFKILWEEKQTHNTYQEALSSAIEHLEKTIVAELDTLRIKCLMSN